MAILIPVDGGNREVAPADPPNFSLKELREYVGGSIGGFIEMVSVPNDDRLFLIVNEEGRLIGLPRNESASQIAGREIVGDAVLVTVVGENLQ